MTTSTARRNREAVRRAARRLFDQLDGATRSSIYDELVWNSFDWRDFFEEKPAPGVVSALAELIEQWEAS